MTQQEDGTESEQKKTSPGDVLYFFLPSPLIPIVVLTDQVS